MLTGVVEVGLFIHMARAAYFGEAVSCLLYKTDFFSPSQADDVLFGLDSLGWIRDCSPSRRPDAENRHPPPIEL